MSDFAKAMVAGPERTPAPRKRVMGQGIDDNGEPLDILECGHAVAAILTADLPRVELPTRRCLECAS